MVKNKEKNISEFNRDVDAHGRYVYTDKKVYSLFVARKRQFDVIAETIRQNFKKKKISLLDVGCGDGSFAIEALQKLQLKKLLGVDAAKKAVLSATKRIPKKFKRKASFKQVNIYTIDTKIKKGQFDLTVIWGVLHHLYEPQKAIAKVTKLGNPIIILEANGYNPLLKIIEKVSPYHIKHEEKSYFAFSLNKWFSNNGYVVKKEKYVGIVPYFCPEPIAKALKRIEPYIEKTPFINKIFCGTVLLYYVKKK